MIIVDTGFFVALGNGNDKFHSLAKEQLSYIKEPLITTYPVIVETSYLLFERSGIITQLKFLRQLSKGGINIFHLEIEHLKRITELMEKYSNLSMDLADASLVFLAKQIRENRILTTDFRDFSIYRLGNNKSFHLLLNKI